MMRRYIAGIQFIGIGTFAAICFLTPPAVSYCLLALLLMRIIIFIKPTKGEKIQSFQNSKKVLFVIDMQDAMCGQYGTYPQRQKVVGEVNKLILEAQQQGQKIVYICQEFIRPDFIFCVLTMGGRLLRGLKGTSLCPQLVYLDNAAIITKHQQDAFTTKKLTEYLNANRVDTISIVGLDAAACVYKTALGAANRGYHVTVLQNGILGKTAHETDKIFRKLNAKGIAIH